MTIDLTRREIMLVGAATTLAGDGLVAVPGMEDAVASPRSEVSALLDSWSEAIRHKDIDRLMAQYAPDIIYFDVVPRSTTLDLMQSVAISCGGSMPGRAPSVRKSAT